MAYELIPRTEGPLSARKAARLLETEFAYTKVDADDGLKHARDRAEWIERAPARIFLGHHEKALETAAKLKSLARGEALTIEFGDNQNDTLTAIVIPGETIRFGYRSNEEQASSRPLVERCARVLGCDIVVM